MNILYVSTTCSKKSISKIFATSNIKIGQSIQKFNHLLLDGFIKEQVRVTALSLVPVNSTTIRQLDIKRKEIENGIEYLYLKNSHGKYVNVISTFISSFYRTLTWGFKNRRRDPVIICDVLKVSICMGSLLASRVLRIKTVGLVTDIPGLMVGDKNDIYSRSATFINHKYINNFDSYILLTEQMNEFVNLRKRPYIIMEGLVDSSINSISTQIKDYPKNIIYSGGIYDRYGVKALIDAFMNIDDKSFNLSIYGDGDLKEYIIDCAQKDNRIKYYGVVENTEVVLAQLKASLLINPRPTHEGFAKYSFPSKNMEYMVSGTPVLTTKLPGMPKEYYEYVYFIEEENTNGIEKCLRKIFSMNEKELFEFGMKAKSFVLLNKNNILQSKRVLDFIDSKVRN